MNVESIQCQKRDMATMERALLRLYLNTHDEAWSEAASRLRGQISWAERVDLDERRGEKRAVCRMQTPWPNF